MFEKRRKTPGMIEDYIMEELDKIKGIVALTNGKTAAESSEESFDVDHETETSLSSEDYC